MPHFYDVFERRRSIPCHRCSLGGDTLKDVLKDAARILKDASDSFPPLKAAMISLVAVIDMVEVFSFHINLPH